MIVAGLTAGMNLRSLALSRIRVCEGSKGEGTRTVQK